MSTTTGLITVTTNAVVAPPAQTGKYLPDQPYLFQPVAVAKFNPRIPGTPQLALNRELVGPTRDYVAAGVINWKWRNLNNGVPVRTGDYFGPPPTLTPYSTTAWHQTVTPFAGAAATYTMDMTTMADWCQVNDKWFAFRLECGNPRKISSRNGVAPPTMLYVYEDGTTETLPVWVVASAGGSLVPDTASAEISLPGFVEFKRPSKKIVSATMTFHVTLHATGASTIRAWLLQPPLNTDGVELGLANAAPLDASLPTDPGIIGVHRYVDGWQLPNFAYSGTISNLNANNSHSPHLFDPLAAENHNLLPFVGTGKWLQIPTSRGNRSWSDYNNFGTPVNEWNEVYSTDTMDGFVPLAPGMGALRMRIYKGRDIVTNELIHDGSRVGSTGSGASGAQIPLPPDKFGTLQEVYTRYYMRIGVLGGGPYIADPADRFNVYQNSVAGATTSPQWSDRGGKTGFTPVHATGFGGLSGSAGGGMGWQLRHGWLETDEVLGGPMEGGWRMSLHSFDFQFQNPRNGTYNYNWGAETPSDASFAQRGGLGAIFYAHQWYCVEMRTKLNSVDQPGTFPDGTPHFVLGVRQFWTADGEIDVWVDGRKVYSRTGLIFRTLPIAKPQGVWNPANQLQPIGNLGHKFIWLNWYHGGVLRAPVDYVSFFTGLAWGTQYIGPMRLA